MTRLLSAVLVAAVALGISRADEPARPSVAVGHRAPEFTFKDPSGKTVDLAALFAKGPVLVRLTCGCAGCDKELAYFQEIDAAYKTAGLTSVAIFKEPDAKVGTYARDKKLNLLYGVDPAGASWAVFQTKAMPTNVLIGKGGEILAIAAGCDPTGLLAKRLSDRIAKAVETDAVDVKARVESRK